MLLTGLGELVGGFNSVMCVRESVCVGGGAGTEGNRDRKLDGRKSILFLLDLLLLVG